MNKQSLPRNPRLKTFLLLPLLLLIAATLSSCATLKKDDCLEGDWATIGYKDGSAGRRSVVQLEGHKRACAKYKVAPDKPVYDAGYKKGLTQFCTQPSGYAYGVKGKEYFGVCPAAMQKGFVSGYVAGLDVAMHRVAAEIRDLRHEELRLEFSRGRSRHFDRDRGNHKDNDKGRDRDKARNDRKHRDHLENRIDSIESAISSRRSDLWTMKRWHDAWAAKLK